MGEREEWQGYVFGHKPVPIGSLSSSKVVLEVSCRAINQTFHVRPTKGIKTATKDL